MTLRRWLLALVFASALCAAETPPAELLFQALQKSNAAAVNRLLDGGADPNARDADGTPSLMAAVLYAGADCVKLRLDRGADPNAANKVGATALMWAVPDLAKSRLLIAAGANVDACEEHAAHAVARRRELSQIRPRAAITARPRRRYSRQGSPWRACARSGNSFRRCRRVPLSG